MSHQYNDAINFIESLIDYEKLRPTSYTEEEYDIKGFKTFVEFLGNPDKNYHTVHIAGTKGKGSTSHFIEFLLRSSGYKTGLYTSPHIADFTERIKNNGLDISKDEFAEYIMSLAIQNESLRPESRNLFRTVFELLTAAGLLYFSDKKADIAIIETGLGGRLDCTNIISPMVSVITPLGLDHIAILGDTLSKIAFEKGGIIKENTPVIIAKQSTESQNEAMPILFKIAKEKNAKTVLAEEIFPVLSCSSDGSTSNIKFGSPWGEPLELSINLAGEHQAYNLQTALACAYTLNQLGDTVDLRKFNRTNITISLQGRIEKVSTNPLIILDGAHCPLSVEMLCRTLNADFKFSKIIFLFGALQDKNCADMLKILQENIKKECEIIIFPPPSKRASNPEKILRTAEIYFSKCSITGSVEEALDMAKTLLSEDAACVLLGSLYSINPARKHLENIGIIGRPPAKKDTIL